MEIGCLLELSQTKFHTSTFSNDSKTIKATTCHTRCTHNMGENIHFLFYGLQLKVKISLATQTFDFMTVTSIES